MYDRIGKKIKALAKVCCWVGIVASVIGGIVSWVAIDDEVGLLLFLLVAGVGSLLSWVSGFILYGFGELIDKTCDIERNTRGGKIVSEVQAEAIDERINKIEKLRSEGLITEEEYQQAVTKARSEI